jgi:cellulose synthase/poly-beta-1,6-N-acetylglucosamine synthase-like glycosyltransferase
MVNQSRPAQLIWVVDDGSMTDYSALARHWVGSWPNGTEVRWSRQRNEGKRRAHARVFESVPEADVFVTVDSDTTLERRALEEGLKPLQSRRVMSVAGIEMGFNANVNLLTRLQSSLQRGVVGGRRHVHEPRPVRAVPGGDGPRVLAGLPGRDILRPTGDIGR